MTYFNEISTNLSQFLFVILCAVWRSVENQCVTRFRGNGLLMRVMRAGLGDTSTIGISIPAKNIITFSIRISLLCWAQGEHFPRKSFSIWIESLLRGVMIGMIVMMTISKLMSVLSKRMEFFWQYFQLLCFSVTRTTLTLCESLFSLNLSKQHCPLWFKYQFTCQTRIVMFLAKYIPSVFFHDMKRREHIS